MSESNGSGFDPLGLKSLGKTGEKIVEFGLAGAKEFLKLTCKPLLEEIGAMGRDQFAYWKLNNLIRMLGKAKGKLNIDPTTHQLVIDPRVAFQIAENASQVSNDTLLDMWAGLFASSCDRYEEDENIFFIDLLKRLTSSQVKLISYLCENSNKKIDIRNISASEIDGVVFAGELKMSYSDVCSIMASGSRLKVDTELDTLENMGLIRKAQGVQQNIPITQSLKTYNGNAIGITLKTLRLYIKCQGSVKTPYEYFFDDVNYYYYNIIKDYIEVEPLNTLQHIKKVNEIGSQYKDDIEYGNELVIKNESWFELPTEVLNERMRAWLLSRYLVGIDRTFVVQANESHWNFNYKDGIHNR
jgi:hypothetical protein